MGGKYCQEGRINYISSEWPIAECHPLDTARYISTYETVKISVGIVYLHSTRCNSLSSKKHLIGTFMTPFVFCFFVVAVKHQYQ